MNLISRKTIGFAFVALILIGNTGCAVKYNHHSVQIENGNSKYKVNIEMQTRYKALDPKASNTIIVYINGKKALKGPLDATAKGSLEGMFDNKQLEVQCEREGIFDADSKCVVYLGGVKLGKYKLVQNVN